MNAQSLSFGPFELLTDRRLLLRAGVPVKIGSRALHLLITLASHPGEVVTNTQLMAEVWPDLTVDESNIRVHMAALRKILGDAPGSGSYITNIPGRGYSFIAPVAASAQPAAAPRAPLDARPALPANALFGRHETVADIADELTRSRLVTLVGSGGIGKTSTARAVMEHFSRDTRRSTFFIDFSALEDPQRVAGTVAAALSLFSSTAEPERLLARELDGRRILLVLDNCEHLVDAIATLVERLLLETAGPVILATSREPLRTRGEKIKRLQPLALPPETGRPTAAEAGRYPALQLFAARAEAAAPGFRLDDGNIAAATAVCRRLEGIPLTIELAAARLDILSVGALATGIDDHLGLLSRGYRTYSGRQQTLRATLDWSHALLTPDEQAALRRVALFRSEFPMESAAFVVRGSAEASGRFLDALSGLVSKSMLVTVNRPGQVLFRLLETTRSYALEKLADAGEGTLARERMATLLARQFAADEGDWEGETTPARMEFYRRNLNDVRETLRWGFDGEGNSVEAIRITAYSAPLWLQFGYIAEYGRLIELALARLADLPEEMPEEEMRLKTALSACLFNLRGFTDETRAAALRAQQLAERLAMPVFELRVLKLLYTAANYASDCRLALEHARSFGEIAANYPGQSVLRFVHRRMLAVAHLRLGHLDEARVHAEAALAVTPRENPALLRTSFHYDPWIVARAARALVLWCKGHFAAGERESAAILDDALALGHAPTICYVIVTTCVLLPLWSGDARGTRRSIDLLQRHADEHGLGHWREWASYLELCLQLQGGRRGPAPLDWAPPSLLHSELLGPSHPALVDASFIAHIDADPENWMAAEAWRVRSLQLLAEDPVRHEQEAEILLMRAIETARRQSHLAWQLRAEADLARFNLTRGRTAPAVTRLRAVLAELVEPSGSGIVIDCRALLDEALARQGGGRTEGCSLVATAKNSLARA
ncbi:winged helix-turn-helix domain-containing protein [Radicibacter daui]|uniref:winged helix-turn-helix domain-containing protein n=1 Tax=Radicibacter daui TaxID=3064829 RepID=UPI004046C7A5